MDPTLLHYTIPEEKGTDKAKDKNEYKKAKKLSLYGLASSDVNISRQIMQ